MLVWMLSNYLAKDGDISPKYVSLGERAVQLRVLHFLNSCLNNDVISSDITIKSITSGIIYSILSVLITVFDPDRTGLGSDIHQGSLMVLKESLIASDFWKQGFQTGLGFVLGGYLTKFPVTLKPVLEICTALASASYKSAREVINILQNLSSYTEPVENVSVNEIAQSDGADGDKWVAMVNRFPYSNSDTICIPAKSKALCDGQLFQWRIRLNAWQLFLCEIDSLIKQVSAGFKNVNISTLNAVTVIYFFLILLIFPI